MKKTQNLIPPFRLQEKICPFTIELKKSMHTENDISERNTDIAKTSDTLIKPFEFLTNDTLIKPFEFLTDDVSQIAENMCLPLKSICGDDTKSLIPYVGLGLQKYKNAGYEIPPITPALGQDFNQSNFNFGLTLQKKVVRIMDSENGEKHEISYKMLIQIYYTDGSRESFETEVEGNKVKNFSWVNRATNGLAKSPRDKDEKIEFDSLVQKCIETKNAPLEFIYPNAGWRKIKNLGWRYVYGSGTVGVPGNNIHTLRQEENFPFPSQQHNQYEIFVKALKMMKICRSGCASSLLFLFVHAATLQTFFLESGFPINFVFGIIGVTNSRKTSLALEICKIFDGNKKSADAEFTATAAGIEKTLSKYKDAPIVIDDFRPGETRAEQIELNKKLEALVRFYGNRIPKKRMDDYSGNSGKFFPIQGVCVLTMEVVTGVLSSLSRMMLVEIDKNEVLNECLLFYQHNSWILPIHLLDFIQWATDFQEFIMSTISTQFPNLRTQYKFDFQRFGEMYSVFHLIAEFIGNYAQNRKFWSSEDSAIFIQNCDCTVISILKKMEKRLKKSDKGIFVANALLEAIDIGILCVTQLNEETCQKKALAYEDSTRFFVQTKVIKKIAEDYCSTYKINTQFVNDEEIITSLERLEIIETIEKNGSKERSRKLPMQHGNHLRYLYLNKKKLTEAINKNQ